MPPTPPAPTTPGPAARRRTPLAARAPALLAALLLAGLSACSIAPGPAPVARYFAPELPAPAAHDGPSAGTINVRQVTASTHLGQRIAWRASDVEYGYHEYLRWTEGPQDYVADALEAVLFQSGRFERTRRSGTPALVVHLHAFEEVHEADGGHDVAIELTAMLEMDDGRITVDRRYSGRAEASPAHVDDPAEVVRALSRLLAEVLDELVADVDAAARAG